LGYVDLSIKEPKANFFPKTIFIRAFTRDVNFIKEFTFVPSKPVTKLKIWTLGEYGWDYNGSRPLVDPENVILPDNMGQKIIDDIIKFQNNYEWYAEKGIPYKLGHLLSGVPGAGKSTIIAMVASVLKKNLAFINMNDVMNDRELMLALNTLPQNSILAIEDIDATKSVQTNRDDPKDVETTKGSTTGNGVSLSGILNVFDGPATPHGLIFFVTTNNKDALDPAIFRPGRIDKDIEFGYVNEEQCKKAYKKFFPNSTEEEINVFTKEFMSGEGQPFSKLQQVLMEKING
jgi:SpoVK/Ycf46/Vps4 family AAA+-type ATPase